MTEIDFTIGDYVMVNGFTGRVLSISRDKAEVEVSYKGNKMIYSMKTSELSPVYITEKFMQDNKDNFKVKEGFKFYYEVPCKSCRNIVIYPYNQPDISICKVFTDGRGQHYVIINILCVHHLQHFLRTVGCNIQLVI